MIIHKFGSVNILIPAKIYLD